jgi:eukaryotic-like serine/threonine-protein kinase
LASSANAYPTDPLAAAATEPNSGMPEGSPGMAQTRVDAAALLVEVPVRAYSTYEPGVIVAQKFQLVRMLGEGGMGSVWVAKNLALDVHIALKLIRAELAQSVAGLEERLLQEARAAASIDHPAVIQIFDFGLTELRDPFIAMELLHGESLAGTIKRRGKVSPVRAVQTLLPIADALLSAHERGIVHRDLKPDNIFLSRGAGSGLEPKVLDFGIAKFDRKLTPNLTSAGTILGSPAYMSPEQARGETDVDGRTDVWALCVVLYEAITGRLPFSGENYNALMYAILEGQPKTFGDLGINEPLLWSIIVRGLEKERGRRCPDMFELGRALAVWLLGRGVEEDICHALLKSKWLERTQRQATTPGNSFFPSDPPAATLRSNDDPLMPVDAEGKPSSGVLLRPAGEAVASHLFGTQFATTGKRVAVSVAQGVLARLVREARSRWVWLTIAGAALSFSAAVGLQALSGSHEDDEPRITRLDEPRRSQIPLATVPTAVEMPRPLASAMVAPSSAPAVRRPSAEVRVPSPKPTRAFDPKVAPSDLKNPFR